ncbi:peptidyl-prolyl cis-trans isomerase FKBP62 [Gossypium australe]|uniref:peptidylprolyl isomerase n=1 Tax=Gossypium australe TaxID=47621 RepID=A0A5B6VYZ9_9ROSI|nr:peptidyl-prolyl cis-trans isomerase FKBP62 [Gossypium australe]
MSISCAVKVVPIVLLLVLFALGLYYKPPSCEFQAHKGDRVKVHYRNILASKLLWLEVIAYYLRGVSFLVYINFHPFLQGKLTDGKVFDSSFERGDPIEFELGSGQVIKGWDQGLLGMCVGERRKLKIPAKLGYGEQGSPPTIPGGATLIFDTELVSVNGKLSSGEDTSEDEL